MSKDNDLKDVIEHLASFGWSEEKARTFAKDKISYLTIQVPHAGSAEILQALCTEGVPSKPFIVVFMVPQSRVEAFKQVAERVANKLGGFFLPGAEKDGIVGYHPAPTKEKLN